MRLQLSYASVGQASGNANPAMARPGPGQTTNRRETSPSGCLGAGGINTARPSREGWRSSFVHALRSGCQCARLMQSHHCVHRRRRLMRVSGVFGNAYDHYTSWQVSNPSLGQLRLLNAMTLNPSRRRTTLSIRPTSMRECSGFMKRLRDGCLLNCHARHLTMPVKALT